MRCVPHGPARSVVRLWSSTFPGIDTGPPSYRHSGISICDDRSLCSMVICVPVFLPQIVPFVPRCAGLALSLQDAAKVGCRSGSGLMTRGRQRGRCDGAKAFRAGSGVGRVARPLVQNESRAATHAYSNGPCGPHLDRFRLFTRTCCASGHEPPRTVDGRGQPSSDAEFCRAGRACGGAQQR